MSPHAFGHLYEICATFTIAYILIDQLNENSFIRQISEKVLKKYVNINGLFEEVRSKITGHRTSIRSILKLGLTDPSIPGDSKRYLANLNHIETQVERVWVKIQNRIRKNYRSDTFIFLNFFLFLYCLSMLYFGGLYEGMIHHNLPLENMDKTLCFFLAVSMLVLIVGWFLDKPKNKKNETFQDIENAAERATLVPTGINVYLIALYTFLGLVVFSVVWFYVIKYSCFDFSNTQTHNILIFSSVFLPISNFVIYFFKAHWRSKYTLTLLTEGCVEKCDRFNNRLKQVEDFVTYCKVIKTKGRKVTLEFLPSQPNNPAEKK